MAKRKTQGEEAKGEPKGAKDESKGRARETGKTRAFTFELEASLDDALETTAKRDKRTKKAVLTIALERYLRGEGTLQ